MRNTILQGDSRELIKTLPDESVDCVITSPPYLWLRDYGVADQIGLEKSMQEYLETMWGLFDEIKRVLKKTGTVWVNLGDTYSGMKVGNTNNNMKAGIAEMELVKPKTKIPDKSLMAIPDRFKIGMIDRGWICRNEIIWYKRNAMPSSAKDRFTVDFEKVFFFTKSQRYYFETQYEPYSLATMKEIEKPYTGTAVKDYDGTGAQNPSDAKRSMVNSIRKQMPKFGGNKAEGYGNPTYSGNEWQPQTFGRLKRTVWDIPTQPFSEAHFATYPEELVSNCIKAGCPEYVCIKCGTPRKSKTYKEIRINTRPGTNIGTGKSGTDADPNSELHKSDLSKYRQQIIRVPEDEYPEEHPITVLIDNQEIEVGKEKTWGCRCGAGFQPGVILDPFFGSGTTGVVALKLARDFVGFELNGEYIKIAEKRLAPLLNQTRLI